MGHASTYHTVLKASPGAAIFGRDMLFDIPFIADWKIFGDHRQRLTDLNTASENEERIDYDYKVGQKILVRNEDILRKAQSIWQKDPWTITIVHTNGNGTITIQRGNKLERLNIRRVKPCVCVCKLGLHNAGAFSRRGINPQASAPTARHCS